MIKKIRSKILPALLSATLSFPSFASWQPAKGEISYVIADNNGRYTSQLHRDTDYQSRKSWFINNGGNLIGDEVHEAQHYQDLAFTSAIARHIQRSQTLTDQIEHYQENFKQLLKYYNIKTIAKSALTYGSQLEGALITALPGSVGSTATSQFKAIESLAKKAALRFADEITKKIYVQDPNINKVELSKQITKEVEQTALKEIGEAYNKLESAKRKLTTHSGPWTPKDASEFYSDYKSGVVYGSAYAELLLDINPVNPHSLLKDFAINAAKGLGIPEKVLLKSPNVKNFLAPPQLKDKIANLELYISKNSDIFNPIEEYYTKIERPSSATQSNIHDLDKKSNRSDIISLGWSFSKDGGDITMRQNETACLNIAVLNQNLDGKKFKNLDIIIDDILDPQLRKSSQQSINLRVRYGDETATSPVEYEPGNPKIINNAVCATSLYEKGHFAIKYHFTYKDENNTQRSTRQFTNTIKVE